MWIRCEGTHKTSKNKLVNFDQVSFIDEKVTIDSAEDGTERCGVTICLIHDYSFVASNTPHFAGVQRENVGSQMITFYFKKEYEALQFRDRLYRLLEHKEKEEVKLKKMRVKRTIY